jgi:chromosome segregation ATPase
MLEELSIALNNYYGMRSIKSGKSKNLVLTPINNNKNDINQYENIPPNGILYDYNNPISPNFILTPNYNYKNRIFTPNYQNNQHINFLYRQPNSSKNILINNYNKDIKKRPKSAAKIIKNQNNFQNGNYTFTENSYNDNNKNNKNKKDGIKKNNKSTLLKNIKLDNNIINDDDYDINYNMNQFENMINAINLNGFHKLKDEINNKKILIAQLENSIAVLKNKIYICKNNLYNGLHRETKNQIKYENMLCVSNRFKNIGKTADSYKNDIQNFQNRINEINNETMQLKNISLNEQNYIEIMKEEIKKGNKGISDKQKEIENILPALQLLKKHIGSIRQKISQFNNIKKNYIEELGFIGNKI